MRRRRSIRVGGRALALAALTLAAVEVVPHLFVSVDTAWMPVILGAAAGLAVLLAFGGHAGHMLREADEEARMQRLRLSALGRIGAGVDAGLAGTGELEAALQGLRQACAADLVAWITDGATDDVWPAALVVSQAGAIPSPFVSPAWEGLARPVAGGRSLAAVEDVRRLAPAEQNAWPWVSAHGLRSAVAVRVRPEGAAPAVLAAGWGAERRLAPDELRFLQDAAGLLAATAVQRTLRRETQRLAALEERDRLAREMHDGVAQGLTYLKLRAEAALTHAARPSGLPLVTAGLDAIRQAALDALGDVRQALMDLRASAPGGVGGFADHLADYLHRWSRFNGIEADLLLPHGQVGLPEDAEFQVLRIVSEALANARKHADAGHVWVRLDHEAGVITMTVADDGRGFDWRDAQRPGHYGLGILRERAAAIGGAVTFAARPEGGTQVVLRLPAARAVGVALVSGGSS